MRRIAFIFLMVSVSLSAQPAQSPSHLTWQMQDSGTTAGLRGIDSVDGKIAWASGTNGTVLKTIDGGEHWTQCAIPDADKDGATLDFRGIQAWDAQIAIVMASGPGDKSRLYKTIDGCRSWKLVYKNPHSPAGFFDSVYFPKSHTLVRDDEGFGLLLGDPVGPGFVVFETRDGGHTWTRIFDKILEASGTDSGAFAASNKCISGFGGSTFNIVIGGKAGSFLIRLSYTGKWWVNDGSPLARTWTKEGLPMARDADSTGAFAVAERVSIPEGLKSRSLEDLRLHEIVVGGDYSKLNETVGTAAWNAPGGQHWTASTTPPHGYRSTVQWSQDLKAWIAAGTNGSDLSRDDGKTWTPIDDGNWNALSLPFVVGPKGRIARLSTTLPAPKP
jgi:photosystem II stability/assembly factor-like uncharacterized protein